MPYTNTAKATKIVEKNVLKKDITSTIIYFLKSLKNPEIKVQNLLLTNKDKIKCVSNFDGLDYGIEINEKSKELIIKYPEINKDLNNLHKEKQIEWILSNCSFLPLKITTI